MPKSGDRFMETKRAPMIGRESEPVGSMRTGVVDAVYPNGHVRCHFDTGEVMTYQTAPMFDRYTRPQ